MPGELLTVKEYAARQGMTEQAVYKQIKTGKLSIVEIQENGKPKKYIFCPMDPAAAVTGNAANQRPEEPAAPEQPIETYDKASAALEKAITALSAQLEEKDRQINRLTELLNQSQQLQAHSQKLLEQGHQTPEDAPEEKQSESADGEPEPAETLEPPAAQPKKRSFWLWLFGE